MEYITLFLPIILGCVCGTIVGILPGVGTSTVLIILYPFLLDYNLPQLFTFYSCILVVSQYCGSVSAILLGIPGEITSLPAVKEGHRLQLIGQGEPAIKITAIYSFVGGVIAVGIFWIILTSIESIFGVYQNKIQMIFLTLCIACVILLCNNKIYINLALIIIGGVLGKIGYNEFEDTEFLTFNNDYLSLGIPTFAILVFLYVVPTLLAFNDFEKIVLTNKQRMIKVKKTISYFWVSVYSSLIGFFAGLIPGTSYVMSSHLAWSAEKMIQGKQYQLPSASALVAAETSNNSAIVSTLIPLLLFAVPITVSEAVIYNIAMVSGQYWTLSWLFETKNQLIMIIGFLSANIFGLFVAWPFAKTVISFVKKQVKYLIPILLCVLIGIYLYHGYINSTPKYYAIIGAVLLPFGILSKKLDMIPLVIGFVLIERFELVLKIFKVQIGL